MSKITIQIEDKLLDEIAEQSFKKRINRCRLIRELLEKGLKELKDANGWHIPSWHR